MELPGALLETTFFPDHVVAVGHEDGSVHLLMYVGAADGGFVSLQHAVISPEHASGLGMVSVPSPETRDAAQLELELSEPEPVPAPYVNTDNIAEMLESLGLEA